MNQVLDAPNIRSQVPASRARRNIQQPGKLKLDQDHAGPIRDVFYHLEAVVFLVEDRLFKVPKYRFITDSDIFHAAFTLPNTGQNVEGTSDEHPFKLEGVDRVDFQRLLKVIYPLEAPQSPVLTQDEWISVLKLSTMWNMLSIRNAAIQALTLTAMVPLDKIILAQQYGVPDWLSSGLQDLVNRPDGITIVEAETLGLGIAIRLYQVREARSRNSYYDIASGIQATFVEELKDVRLSSAEYSRPRRGGPESEAE